MVKKLFSTVAIAAIMSQAAISFEPVTQNSTEQAKKLYNFLATNYGVKTISGFMTGNINSATVKELEDVVAFKERTGKFPALVGFDFLFATGTKANDSWYKQYTQMALDGAKDLWNLGGIPAFTWHWKDPLDKVDAFYNKSGNAKEYTDFDFSAAFTDKTCTSNCTWDTTSSVYKAMISDIDEIADMFLSLQEAGVAAIFRPLHEASGKWFWWGNNNGAAFVALYNLVYDEMVNVKGVKNLVWVWNPEYAKDTDWNPGATKYDVISLDIYEAWDYSTKFVDAYKDLSTNFGSDKIFAISENGPIPDMSVMAENNSKWSWWMPWYQTWNGKFLDQTVDAVWKANLESNCTISLNDMPGWDKYTVSTQKVAPCEVNYNLQDLDTARPIVENVPSDTATNTWLQVKLSGAAKGNIIIKEGKIKELQTAKKVTLDVFNANTMTGIWFTVAFLGDATNNYAWAQPEGCWVNAGEEKNCEIDLATTAKDKEILSESDYTDFMKTVSKMYIEVFAEDFSGTVYYDNVKVDNTIINDFNTKQKITVEEATNLKANLFGNGLTTAIKAKKVLVDSKISVIGNTLTLNLPNANTISVDVFSMSGKRIATLYKGATSAGTNAFDLSNISKGHYIIRIKGMGIMATKPIHIK